MSNFLSRWVRPMTMPYVVQDILLAIPRLVAGFWMTAYFGAPKFGLPWTEPEKNLDLFEVVFWFPSDVAEFGGFFSLLAPNLAWLGAFAEGIGGIAWMVGWQTRFFSVLIGITMAVAVFCQQIDHGLWNMLPAIGFLWLSLFYGILGSGRLGLDYLFTQPARSFHWANPLPMVLVTFGLALWSPVQKANPQRVLVQLDVSDYPGVVNSVGIRGDGNPLSWQTDLPCKKNEQTGQYEAEFTSMTGYLTTELKFTVNGEFELKDQPNRVVRFDPDQTTHLKATWNQVK